MPGVLTTATALSRDNGDVRKSPRVVGSRVSTPCASSPVTVRHAFSVVSVRWEMCELLRVAVSRAWSFGDSQRTVDFSPDPPPHSNKTLHSRVCCHTRLPTTFSDPHGGRSVIDHTSRGVPRDRLDHDDNTEDAPRSTHIHPPPSPILHYRPPLFSDHLDCSVIGIFRREKPQTTRVDPYCQLNPPQPRPILTEATLLPTSYVARPAATFF